MTEKCRIYRAGEKKQQIHTENELFYTGYAVWRSRKSARQSADV